MTWVREQVNSKLDKLAVEQGEKLDKQDCMLEKQGSMLHEQGGESTGSLGREALRPKTLLLSQVCFESCLLLPS